MNIWFSSPSRGSYISTKSEIVTTNSRCFVLVPFSGFLYLYGECHCILEEAAVLVPFSGFLYLYYMRRNIVNALLGSRPLLGVLISLPVSMKNTKSILVLVPFSGFLYLYVAFHLSELSLTAFSSPSRGSYISTGGKYASI